MFGPIASLENFVLKAFNFTGRATRAEYWWAFLAFAFIYLAAIIADIIAIGMSTDISLNPLAYFTPWVFLLSFVPWMTLTARRVHDSGRSSFWIFSVLLPVVGTFWLPMILATKSEPEDNKWGPVPGPNGATSVTRIAPDGKVEKHNPWQSYSVLLNAERPKSEEEIAAQRNQISEYYRTQVLGTRA